MFTFEGENYKSKSEAALEMLKAGKDRVEIASVLGITYQTVHAVMKKAGLKPAPKVKKSTSTKINKVSKNTKTNVVSSPNVDATVTEDGATV